MMDRNQSIDRLARWTVAGVTTAGLSLAIIPLAHGGLRRSSTPKQPVVIAPAAQQPAQPAAAPVYIPQPLYYPAGAPLPQVPPQYNAVQEQVTGQQDSAVSRELRRLYEESGRQAPPLPGSQQPQPAPVAQPAYQVPPGYVAVPAPGYAAAPGFIPAAVPPGYVPQPAYYPQPGYAPAYAAPQHQAPPSQQLSTEAAEDPEFFPGDGLAKKQLDGLEFEQGTRRTQPIPQPAGPQYQQPFAVIPLQQPGQAVQPQRPPGHGFAYPGPASQQQPTPIITAGVVPPGVTPPPSAVKLPSAEELIAGPPIEADYEMAADPKTPKKGFFKRFGSSTKDLGTKPPEEPNPYVPNLAAQMAQEAQDIPLAPSADVPGPEADPAMAEIAKFSMPEPGVAAVTDVPSTPAVVEELPPPEVTPKTRTLPVAAATTIGSAPKKGVASELFKDEQAAPAVETKIEKPAVKPAAPKKSGGIAAGGLGPGKNVVPEQPEPASEGPVAAAAPAPAASPAHEVAEPAAPPAKAASNSPYTGLSLDGPGEAPAPLMARQNRGMFFPPVSAEPQAEPTTEPAPLPITAPAELAPATVQPVSQTPTAKDPERSQYTQSKYEQIASRKGATGLKGFCPVRLRDHRDLADGQAEFRVQHNGRVYALSSGEALKTFLSIPEKYVPAANGYDVVVHQQSGETVEGILDHSAWFKGKLYLFASAENKDAFVTNPAAYAVK